MGVVSGIEWCDKSYSPWFGCIEDGPDCEGCYAKALMQDRFHKAQWGLEPRGRAANSTRKLPARWNRQAQKAGERIIVFGGHLCDVFDDSGSVPEGWLDDFWQQVSDTRYLQWLIPTKRPHAAVEYLRDKPSLSHVMLGISVGYPGAVVRRLQFMTPLKTMGWRVFISAEPLLGQVDLSLERYPADWVIVGGHSREAAAINLAKECKLEWIRHIKAQCDRQGIPFFNKQLGSKPTLNGQPVKLRSRKGGDIARWPEDLRVRDFPIFAPPPTTYATPDGKAHREQLSFLDP